MATDKTIYQFKLNGEFIKSFPDTKTAAEELGISATFINANLNRRSKQVYFRWIFSWTPEFPGYDPHKKGSHAILCFNMDGTLRNSYSSVMLATKGTGVNFGKIYQQCHHKTTDTKMDFYFRYGDKQVVEEIQRPSRTKVVYKYDLDGTYLDQYPSVVSAASAVNLSRQAIQNCCSGLQVTAGGYRWSYTPPPPENKD
jgi:hypothetical protein